MRHDVAPTTAPTATPGSNVGDEPLTYTLAQAAALLRISQATYYRRVRAGQLPGRKLGGQWRVPRAALRRYVESLAEAEGVAS